MIWAIEHEWSNFVYHFLLLVMVTTYECYGGFFGSCIHWFCRALLFLLDYIGCASMAQLKWFFWLPRLQPKCGNFVAVKSKYVLVWFNLGALNSEGIFRNLVTSDTLTIFYKFNAPILCSMFNFLQIILVSVYFNSVSCCRFSIFWLGSDVYMHCLS